MEILSRTNTVGAKTVVGSYNLYTENTCTLSYNIPVSSLFTMVLHTAI